MAAYRVASCFCLVSWYSKLIGLCFYVCVDSGQNHSQTREDSSAVPVSGKSLILPPLFYQFVIFWTPLRVRNHLGIYLRQNTSCSFPSISSPQGVCCSYCQPLILWWKLALFLLRIALRFAVNVLTFQCCLCLQSFCCTRLLVTSILPFLCSHTIWPVVWCIFQLSVNVFYLPTFWYQL